MRFPSRLPYGGTVTMFDQSPSRNPGGTIMTERAGASFEEEDVVENYAFRPPYPEAIFARLAEISPTRAAALDIGCGPGKVARPLARFFDSVTAVDPSGNMIALGRSLPGGDAANIEWIEGFAEDFAIGERRFDLTVAAASIHWMDHQRLFPRLARHGRPATSRLFRVTMLSNHPGGTSGSPSCNAGCRGLPASNTTPRQRHQSGTAIAAASTFLGTSILSRTRSSKALPTSSAASTHAIPSLDQN
jgi:SAM-dependent methyltransferase